MFKNSSYGCPGSISVARGHPLRSYRPFLVHLPFLPCTERGWGERYFNAASRPPRPPLRPAAVMLPRWLPLFAVTSGDASVTQSPILPAAPVRGVRPPSPVPSVVISTPPPPSLLAPQSLPALLPRLRLLQLCLRSLPRSRGTVPEAIETDLLADDSVSNVAAEGRRPKHLLLSLLNIKQCLLAFKCHASSL